MALWVCAACLRHAATRETSPLRDVILRGEAPEPVDPAEDTTETADNVEQAHVGNPAVDEIARAVVDEIERRRKAEHAERMRTARAARKVEQGEAA